MSEELIAARQYLHPPLVLGIDTVPRGHTRLETCFRYPDGTSIDLFIVESTRDPLYTRWMLTDFGHTMSWLLTVQVRPWQSKRRTTFVEDALRINEARLEGGELKVQIPSLSELPAAVIRLGQTCIRVADLMFTRRTSLQSAFAEEVEEAVSDASLPYNADFELLGRQGRKVRVDFLVTGIHASFAILGLTGATPYLAHSAANEIFRKWYDLDTPERTERRLTLLDDRVAVYRDEDVDRIRELSSVVPFSDRRALASTLAAA